MGSAVVEAVVDYSVEVPLAVIEYDYGEGRGRRCLRCRNLAMGCQRLDHRSKEFPAEMDEVLRKHGNQVAVAGGTVLVLVVLSFRGFLAASGLGAKCPRIWRLRFE